MDALAIRIKNAARTASYPDEPDGAYFMYFTSVTASIDLAPYFLELARLSQQPRGSVLAADYWSVFNQDASFLLDAAFRHLLVTVINPADRSTIEAVQALEAWALAYGRG